MVIVEFSLTGVSSKLKDNKNAACKNAKYCLLL